MSTMSRAATSLTRRSSTNIYVMKLRTIFLLLALAVATTAFAQQNKRIAILETVDKEESVPYGVKLLVRSKLSDIITSTPGYEAYDRVDIASIMSEHDFQKTGLVNDLDLKKLGEMTKRLEKHTDKHINSAKHDKAMQDFAKKLSAGEAIAAAMLVGTTNLKYYASIKASTGDSSGLKTAASLVIANVLAGPLGARIYGQAKKSKYIKKGN